MCSRKCRQQSMQLGETFCTNNYAQSISVPQFTPLNSKQAGIVWIFYPRYKLMGQIKSSGNVGWTNMLTGLFFCLMLEECFKLNKLDWKIKTDLYLLSIIWVFLSRKTMSLCDVSCDNLIKLKVVFSKRTFVLLIKLMFCRWNGILDYFEFIHLNIHIIKVEVLIKNNEFRLLNKSQDTGFTPNVGQDFCLSYTSRYYSMQCIFDIKRKATWKLNNLCDILKIFQRPIRLKEIFNFKLVLIIHEFATNL